MSLSMKFISTGFTAIALSAGGAHTCVQRNDLSLVCWGGGGHGQLGNEKSDDIGDGPGEMGYFLQPVNLGTGSVED